MKKHDFYFGILPTSRAQTELKGSEYTPRDALEPPRMAGGGYKGGLNHFFSLAPANRFLSCTAHEI